MMELRRRTLLQSAVVAGAVSSVGGWPLRSPAAAAAPGAREAAVRDAGLVWRSLPEDWRTAPLLGNGTLTAHVHRSADGRGLSFAFSDGRGRWHQVVGSLDLVLAGTPTDLRWDLDLWNGELTGNLTTTRGSVQLGVLAERTRGAVLVSVATSAGEDAAGWVDGTGGELCWRERRTGTHRLVAVAGTPEDRDAVLATDLDELVAEHRRWWHDFHGRGFTSVPDKTVQRFHLAQLYLAASTTRRGHRADGRTHELLTRTDHADLGLAVGRSDAPVPLPGVGSKGGRAQNLVVARDIPAAWSAWQHLGDDELLRESVRPALRRAVAYYRQHLVEGADGMLHLPVTHSPAYADVADSTHDLALLRWATRRLLQADEHLQLTDPRHAEWADLLERLVRYHTGASGVLVGAGTPLHTSHPHPSHLVWLHPLAEGDAVVSRDVAVRSLAHWTAMREAWQGHSHVSAASMSALIGDPHEARDHLRSFLTGGVAADTEVLANTLYRSGRAADQEVGAAASGALLDMLVRADGAQVALFPAAPGDWRDASVASLRLPGGLVVDADRADGCTRWVRVRGGTGRPVLLRHSIPGALRVHDGRGRPVPVRHPGRGVVELHPRDGAEVVVAARDFHGDPEPRDVPADGDGHRWGLPDRTRTASA
ncbi:hypothetical protein F1721_22540 [Saccharopolyspora hirsuta]|uniref:Glycosyl hydrolase family 95 catalytic domain-containing protein n=2 Tax=Saccharopolyspora hirsuta TaxID=1837 RepID=A0A5M7BTS9_SACHI|nr:hypothetical protein [Saccharopolyspora hirsuta]KAA5830634.1 hypothetical protein F1721_22540 [Saccharopolyspora hirsuta]